MEVQANFSDVSKYLSCADSERQIYLKVKYFIAIFDEKLRDSLHSLLVFPKRNLEFNNET